MLPTCSMRMHTASHQRHAALLSRQMAMTAYTNKKPAGAGVRCHAADCRRTGSGFWIWLVFQTALFTVSCVFRAGFSGLFLVLRVGLGIARVACRVGARDGVVARMIGGAAHGQRPSSNTTSRFTDSVVSPGATEVSLLITESEAIARIIGIGRGKLDPPSLMLTIRRTFRPSASA